MSWSSLCSDSAAAISALPSPARLSIAGGAFSGLAWIQEADLHPAWQVNPRRHDTLWAVRAPGTLSWLEGCVVLEERCGRREGRGVTH